MEAAEAISAAAKAAERLAVVERASPELSWAAAASQKEAELLQKRMEEASAAAEKTAGEAEWMSALMPSRGMAGSCAAESVGAVRAASQPSEEEEQYRERKDWEC